MDIKVKHLITAKRQSLLISDMDTDHLINCKNLLESKSKKMTFLINHNRYGKCRAYTKSPEYKAICEELEKRYEI